MEPIFKVERVVRAPVTSTIIEASFNKDLLNFDALEDNSSFDIREEMILYSEHEVSQELSSLSYTSSSL
jgi:hypothetical protein